PGVVRYSIIRSYSPPLYSTLSEKVCHARDTLSAPGRRIPEDRHPQRPAGIPARKEESRPRRRNLGHLGKPFVFWGTAALAGLSFAGQSATRAVGCSPAGTVRHRGHEQPGETLRRGRQRSPHGFPAGPGPDPALGGAPPAAVQDAGVRFP